MKKILSVVIVFILLFTSCKKEEKSCWKCAMFKWNKAGYLDTRNPKISTECNKTEKQIRAYETENTKTMQTYNGNNYQTTTVQAMNCKLDQ
ncbi:MAG: hypothetical protein V4456_12255 [Bacteroidota bacterium]